MRHHTKVSQNKVWGCVFLRTVHEDPKIKQNQIKSNQAKQRATIPKAEGVSCVSCNPHSFARPQKYPRTVVLCPCRFQEEILGSLPLSQRSRFPQPENLSSSSAWLTPLYLLFYVSYSTEFSQTIPKQHECPDSGKYLIILYLQSGSALYWGTLVILLSTFMNGRNSTQPSPLRHRSVPTESAGP